MEKEMVNINANLVKEPEFTRFERKGEEVEVVNFTLVKKYGKGKEYINCSAGNHALRRPVARTNKATRAPGSEPPPRTNRATAALQQ